MPHLKQRSFALLTSAFITLAGGVLYGGYVHRWNAPAELTAAAIQLEKLPRVIGSWRAIDDLSIDESALEMLECAGYVSRQYVNESTGQSIQCAVIVGPPGPIAVHTPEVCFSSRAYDIQGERTETHIKASPSGDHSFWKLDFKSSNASADGLRVYYAWSTGPLWQAATSPRFKYAGEPRLYKIQLAAYVSPSLSPEHADPGQQFLEEFVRLAWHSVVQKDK